MRPAVLMILIGSASVLALSAADESLSTDREKASYGIGMSIGRTLRQQGMDIDLNIMTEAIQDFLQDKKPRLSEEDARNAIIAYQRDSLKRLADGNKKAADAFLEEHKKKEGVQVTASGLQYQVIVEGTGPKPTLTDRVSLHSRGTLSDGTEFENTYKRGTPEKVAVNSPLKAWTEALQMMPVGSKWKLAVPPDLGYGERGRARVPPHSVLLYDLELVGIEPPAPAGPAAEVPKEAPAPK